MNQNVKLPFDLFTDIIRLLLQIDTCGCDETFRVDYDKVLQGLHKKLSTLVLRDAYSKIIYAVDEDSRSLARMQYLQKKLSAQEDC